jgi:hypothetical protein
VGVDRVVEDAAAARSIVDALGEMIEPAQRLRVEIERALRILEAGCDEIAMDPGPV